jgi:hypothetical protein
MNRRDLLVAAPTLMAGGLLANSAAAAAKSPARILLSSSFGAVGDGEADDTAALQRALDQNFNGPEAGIVRIEPGRYRITRPLKIFMERTQDKRRLTRQHGISAYGALIRSDIRDGGSVLEITSDTTCRNLLLEGLEIHGNGREGNGISMQCYGTGRYIYNFSLRDIVVQSVGGDGISMLGNIFEGQIFNGYFRDNKKNGATFGHDDKGGILSALHVFGCVFGGNGGDGAALTNKANDVSFNGCYFLENDKFGLNTSNGVTLLSHCGFENNQRRAGNFQSGDAGIRLLNFGTLIGCTGYSIKYQTHLISAFVVNHLVMVGCTGYGGDQAKDAKLAKLQGNNAGAATIIGCRGGIDRVGGIDAVELGQKGYGAKFGANWNSTALPQLGNYTLWVDKTGKLRIKNGAPQSDDDGRPVGV